MLPKTSPPRIENCSPKWSKSDNHKWLPVCLFSSKKKGRLLKSAMFLPFFLPITNAKTISVRLFTLPPHPEADSFPHPRPNHSICKIPLLQGGGKRRWLQIERAFISIIFMIDRQGTNLFFVRDGHFAHLNQFSTVLGIKIEANWFRTIGCRGGQFRWKDKTGWARAGSALKVD